jgi:[ribosomal protein S5]-alanine N-acetyltransferase
MKGRLRAVFSRQDATMDSTLDPILETQRCRLRPFTPADFDLLYSLHGDPEIMRYIGQGTRTREQVHVHLQSIVAHQDKHGYSQWVVTDLGTGAFIGRAGLVHVGTLIRMETDSRGEAPVELGYVLSKAQWGKGYATEVARACLEWGFFKAQLTEIVAKTHLFNEKSQNVLTKLGMTFVRHVTIEGRQGMYFVLSREAFCDRVKPRPVA